MSYECLKNSVFPSDLDMRIPDHAIIATAMAVRESDPKRKTTVVSRDINMRVICDSLGLKSEDYDNEKAVVSSDQLYPGFVEYLVDDQKIDLFYNGHDVYIDKDEVDEIWHPNQYVMLVSNANQKKTAIARFESHFQPLRKIYHDKLPDWKINSRNKRAGICN